MPKLEHDFPVDKRHYPPWSGGIYLHNILREFAWDRSNTAQPHAHGGGAGRCRRRRSPETWVRHPLQGFALVYWGGQGLLDPLLKCNAKGTSCICSVCLGFVFFCFCFSFAVIKSVCMDGVFNLPYVYPPMGIITVSCKGRLCYATLRMLCSALFFQSCVFFSHFFKGN